MAEMLYDTLHRKIKKGSAGIIIKAPTELSPDLLDIDPKLLAKRLTLIEYDMFRMITIVELLDQIWGDKRKKELSKVEGAKFGTGEETYITKFIKHTNQVGFLFPVGARLICR